MDPTSSSVLEIGSRKHPYKSMRALMSEILNHYSNQDREIEIYLKENTRIYMEDSTNFIINITKVKMTSYSDFGDTIGMATLIPTKIRQSGESKKSAFSIIKNSELDLERIIAETNITLTEIDRILDETVTLKLVRSSFEMSNIEVKHENIDSQSSSLFLSPIFLEDRLVKITDCNFNLTSRIIHSSDSLNLYVENISMNLYSFQHGFFISGA